MPLSETHPRAFEPTAAVSDTEGGEVWRRWFAGLHRCSCTYQLTARSERSSRLRVARRFIEKHASCPLDLDSIAAEACWSPYHFHRQFRAYYGTTPHQFLTEQRLLRAKDLLRDSSLSVTEVCFDVGFDSVGSFSTLFRRHVGTAPSNYRRCLVQSLLTKPSPPIPSCFMRFIHPPTAQVSRI